MDMTIRLTSSGLSGVVPRMDNTVVCTVVACTQSSMPVLDTRNIHPIILDY